MGLGLLLTHLPCFTLPTPPARLQQALHPPVHSIGPPAIPRMCNTHLQSCYENFTLVGCSSAFSPHVVSGSQDCQTHIKMILYLRQPTWG